MKNEWLTNPQGIQIQGLLDRYLRSQIPNENLTARAKHLDEDTLTAFVEGKTNQRETAPIIKHLVACSFCRHVTAELIKLDFAFADAEIQNSASEKQPSKISEVLNTVLSKIFGVGDEAVFAHEEKQERKETDEQETQPNSEKQSE